MGRTNIWQPNYFQTKLPKLFSIRCVQFVKYKKTNQKLISKYKNEKKKKGDIVSKPITLEKAKGAAKCLVVKFSVLTVDLHSIARKELNEYVLTKLKNSEKKNILNVYN